MIIKGKKGEANWSAIFLIPVALLLLVGVWYGAHYAFEKFGTLGFDIKPLDKDIPSWLSFITENVFAIESDAGLLTALIVLAVFMIMLFAMKDIMSAFSTFNETTSWVIAAGLSLIASFTGIISSIAGIFQITAAIGAVGIAIIILTAVVSAIIVNMMFGNLLRKLAVNRDIDEMRQEAKRKGGVIGALSEMATEATKPTGK